MVFSTTAPAADPNSRFEKSLALLTSRFMNLLQSSPTGILDLQEAAEVLKVPQAQRRRIYDITNVLEGVGLIEKTSKKCIRWKGAVAIPELSEEEFNAAAALKNDIEALTEEEKQLDKQLALKKQSLAHTVASSSRHSYVQFQDLCQAFQENTVITVKAPNDTEMNISESEVHLTAINERIKVMMIEKDWDGEILAASIPQENHAGAFGGLDDFRISEPFGGFYDPRFTQEEGFGGVNDPRFIHGVAFGDINDPRFNHKETIGDDYDSRIAHREELGGVYDQRFIQKEAFERIPEFSHEAFSGVHDQGFAHKEAVGGIHNHDQRVNATFVDVEPRTKRKKEGNGGSSAKRSRPCGGSIDEVDKNVLVELDVLMKAVQEIQANDTTEIHTVDNYEKRAVIEQVNAVDNSAETEGVPEIDGDISKKAAEDIDASDNFEKGAFESLALDHPGQKSDDQENPTIIKDVDRKNCSVIVKNVTFSSF